LPSRGSPWAKHENCNCCSSDLVLGYGLDFLFGLWLLLLGTLALERGTLPWLTIGLLPELFCLSRLKVLGGGLCAYGWVTILLYCLW
jgi:hypothetical protein